VTLTPRRRTRDKFHLLRTNAHRRGRHAELTRELAYHLFDVVALGERPNQRLRTSPKGINSSAANTRASRS
jgi:hypothetical protein